MGVPLPDAEDRLEGATVVRIKFRRRYLSPVRSRDCDLRVPILIEPRLFEGLPYIQDGMPATEMSVSGLQVLQVRDPLIPLHGIAVRFVFDFRLRPFDADLCDVHR